MLKNELEDFLAEISYSIVVFAVLVLLLGSAAWSAKFAIKMFTG